MAQVFLALARGPVGFNKLVVLKRMRTQLAQDQALVTMFLDEARLAARLSHPNVINTFEVGEHGGLYFIAMEYLEGQPLNRILAEVRRTGRTVRRAVWTRVLCDALTGLHYAHELKDYDGTPLEIVHRDVSPHNVFVTYDGQVKVVDFGIAKAALHQTKTEVGVLKGKVAYMSPEQALGEKIDRRSDLFAMGIVLWETISGQRLYGHENAAATLHRLLNVPAPPLSTVAADVDPQLEGIVQRALSRRPDDRFQTALQMREAIEAWMQARGEQARTEEVGGLVSELFADVREDVKRQIQAHMSAVPVDPSGSGRRLSQSGPIKWNSGGSSELPAIDIHVEVGSGSGSAVRNAAGPPPATPPAKSGTVSPRGAALIAAIAVAIAAVAGIIVVPRFLHHDTSAESPATIRPDTPAPSVAASSPTPTPAPPQSAAATADTASAAAPMGKPTPTTTAVATGSPPRPSWLPRPPSGHVAPASAPAAPAPKGGGEAAAPAAAPAATDPGFLNFDTYPWTHVSEGGRALGDTPLVHLQMSPGVHVLTLDNAEQSIHQTTAVTIKSGETVSRRLGLK